MSDPRRRRLAALVDGLTAAHLDGLLLTGLSNIRYLTGFSGSSALLVVSARDVVLITDFRYQTQVVDEVGDLARIVHRAVEPLDRALAAARAARRTRRCSASRRRTSCIATSSGCSRPDRGGSGDRRSISSRRCASERTTGEIARISEAANVATTRARSHAAADPRRDDASSQSPASSRRRCATRGARDFPFRRSSRAGRARRCRTRTRRRGASSAATSC